MKPETIVNLLYRHIKGHPLTEGEKNLFHAWLQKSESNRRILESLSDEAWLAEAKKRYYAPGKEEGLQQLRQQLFNESPTPLTWWQRLKKRFLLQL